MKRRLPLYRFGGLITALICLAGSLLARFHNVSLDILSVCLAIASLAIFVRIGRRNRGFRWS